MSLFPNIFNTAVYNTQLAPYPHQNPPQAHHAGPSFLERHHPADILHAILLHMFTPSVYHQPTCTHSPAQIHQNLEPEHHSKQKVKVHVDVVKKESRIIVDDDFVCVEERCREDEEEDGGPICREAEIDAWKACSWRSSVRPRR